MKYRVEFAQRARSDLSEIYTWISLDSAIEAARWVNLLEASISSLDVIPERCPHAPEDGELDGVEVRHKIVGGYRVVFQIRGSIVHVLHIRHSSRSPATPGDLSE